jgi:allophanate hydrolase subunit 2
MDRPSEGIRRLVVVIRADLGELAQMPARPVVRFQRYLLDQARALKGRHPG